MRAKRLRERRAHLLLNAEHLRDRGWHQQWIGDRAELHHPDAVTVGIHHLDSHLQRKPRLADATDAHESQQAFTRQQPLDLDQFAFAADERRQGCGQIRALDATYIVSRQIIPKLGERPDEPVTPPCQGLYPALAPGYLREYAPDRRDLHGEIAFLNDHARPRGVDDAALGDVLIGALGESAQHRDPA